MMEVNTKHRTISKSSPVYVIAEMAWSHDGKLCHALEIVRAAAEAKADALSIHITSLPDYMVPHYGSGAGRVSAGHETSSVYKYLESISLSPSDWKAVTKEAHDLGLDVIVMCNDLPSIEVARELDPDGYVLSPASFVESELVATLAKERKPAFLRIGGATLGEIEEVVHTFAQSGNHQLVLLHGFQSYPTALADTNLNLIPTLSQIFNLPVGIADHVDGADPMAFIVPIMALPLGAVAIEKHLTHNRELKGEDFESAFGPDDFKKFVSMVRGASEALGTAAWKPLSERVVAYRGVVRKRVVATRDLDASTILTRDMVTVKRGDEGLSSGELSRVIGRQLKVSVLKDQGIDHSTLV